ncbi:hypothetical protein DIPPA_26524 [Diplonema papillatum]|nr:hypothetical protein DIPPA_26524 [Diplonema papillatum]
MLKARLSRVAAGAFALALAVTLVVFSLEFGGGDDRRDEWRRLQESEQQATRVFATVEPVRVKRRAAFDKLGSLRQAEVAGAGHGFPRATANGGQAVGSESVSEGSLAQKKGPNPLAIQVEYGDAGSAAGGVAIEGDRVSEGLPAQRKGPKPLAKLKEDEDAGSAAGSVANALKVPQHELDHRASEGLPAQRKGPKSLASQNEHGEAGSAAGTANRAQGDARDAQALGGEAGQRGSKPNQVEETGAGTDESLGSKSSEGDALVDNEDKPLQKATHARSKDVRETKSLHASEGAEARESVRESDSISEAHDSMEKGDSLSSEGDALLQKATHARSKDGRESHLHANGETGEHESMEEDSILSEVDSLVEDEDKPLQKATDARSEDVHVSKQLRANGGSDAHESMGEGDSILTGLDALVEEEDTPLKTATDALSKDVHDSKTLHANGGSAAHESMEEAASALSKADARVKKEDKPLKKATDARSKDVHDSKQLHANGGSDAYESMVEKVESVLSKADALVKEEDKPVKMALHGVHDSKPLHANGGTEAHESSEEGDSIVSDIDALAEDEDKPLKEAHARPRDVRNSQQLHAKKGTEAHELMEKDVTIVSEVDPLDDKPSKKATHARDPKPLHAKKGTEAHELMEKDVTIVSEVDPLDDKPSKKATHARDPKPLHANGGTEAHESMEEGGSILPKVDALLGKGDDLLKKAKRAHAKDARDSKSHAHGEAAVGAHQSAEGSGSFLPKVDALDTPAKKAKHARSKDVPDSKPLHVNGGTNGGRHESTKKDDSALSEADALVGKGDMSSKKAKPVRSKVVHATGGTDGGRHKSAPEGDSASSEVESLMEKGDTSLKKAKPVRSNEAGASNLSSASLQVEEKHGLPKKAKNMREKDVRRGSKPLHASGRAGDGVHGSAEEGDSKILKADALVEKNDAPLKKAKHARSGDVRDSKPVHASGGTASGMHESVRKGALNTTAKADRVRVSEVDRGSKPLHTPGYVKESTKAATHTREDKAIASHGDTPPKKTKKARGKEQDGSGAEAQLPSKQEEDRKINVSHSAASGAKVVTDAKDEPVGKPKGRVTTNNGLASATEISNGGLKKRQPKPKKVTQTEEMGAHKTPAPGSKKNHQPAEQGARKSENGRRDHRTDEKGHKSEDGKTGHQTDEKGDHKPDDGKTGHQTKEKGHTSEDGRTDHQTDEQGDHKPDDGKTGHQTNEKGHTSEDGRKDRRTDEKGDHKPDDGKTGHQTNEKGHTSEDGRKDHQTDENGGSHANDHPDPADTTACPDDPSLADDYLTVVVSATKTDANGYPRLPLLLKSLLRFGTPAIGEVLIVTPTEGEKRAIEATAEKVLPKDGTRGFTVSVVLDEAVLATDFSVLERLLPKRETSATGGRGAGYRASMILKLMASKHVKSKFYITMDTDVFLKRRIGPVGSLTPSGKAVIQGPDLAGRHRQSWWSSSLALLQTQSDAACKLKEAKPPVIGVTPAILSTSLSRCLLHHISSTHGGDPPDKVLFQSLGSESTSDWTEYTLYWTYACLFDHINTYHTTDPIKDPATGKVLKLYDNSGFEWGSFARMDIHKVFEHPSFFGVIQSINGAPAEAVIRKVLPMLEGT